MTKPVAIGWTALVFGIGLVIFALGWKGGVTSERARARRFNAAALAGGSVAVEVQAAGGVIVTGKTPDGWASVLTIDGKAHVGTGATPEAAEKAALLEWKSL